MTATIALLLPLTFALAACGGVSDFYEKEYVLHDGTTPSDPATGDGADQGSEEAGEVGSTEAAAAGAGGAAIAAEPGGVPGDDLERIFVLENLYDELGRAIRDGVGDLEALQTKQQDVEREIRWRREAAGEAYAAARSARLEQLRGFPVVVK